MSLNVSSRFIDASIADIAIVNKQACSKVTDENIASLLEIVKTRICSQENAPSSQMSVADAKKWQLFEAELDRLWEKFSSKCSNTTRQKIQTIRNLAEQHLQPTATVASSVKTKKLNPEQFLHFDCAAQKVELLQRTAASYEIESEAFMQESIGICTMFDAIATETKVKKDLLRKLHEEKSINEIKIHEALENDRDDEAASIVRDTIAMQRCIDSLERESVPSVHIQELIVTAKEKSSCIKVCEEVIARVKERTYELQQLLRQMPYKQFLHQLEKFERAQRLPEDATIRSIQIPPLSHTELLAVDEGNVEKELIAAEQLIRNGASQDVEGLSPSVFMRDFNREVYRVGSHEFGATESATSAPADLVGVNKVLNTLIEEQLDKVAHLHFKTTPTDVRKAVVNTIRAQIESFWHQGMIKPAIAPLLAAVTSIQKNEEQEFVLVNHTVPVTMKEISTIKKSALSTKNSVEQALLFRNWAAQKDPVDAHALLFRATRVQKVVRIEDRNSRPLGYVSVQAQIKVDFSKIKLSSLLVSPGVLSCTSSVHYADALGELFL